MFYIISCCFKYLMINQVKCHKYSVQILEKDEHYIIFFFLKFHFSCIFSEMHKGPYVLCHEKL